MSKIILSEKPGPIGIFDSGYGGLTILKHIRSAMPVDKGTVIMTIRNVFLTACRK